MARLWALALLCSASLWAQAGRVSGFVLDEITRQPVARAVVTLATTGIEPAQDAVAYSDSRGGFAFTRLPAGKYLLTAEREGYGVSYFGSSAPEEGSPPEILVLKQGELRDGLQVRLRPLGSISGVVVDPDGDPVSHAMVQLLMSGFERGKPRYFPVGGAQSDSRGAYRLSGLRPGTYFVLASHQFGPVRTIHVEGTPERPGQGPALGVQYYPNADRISAAAPIALGPGKQLTGIDFHLPLQNVVSIVGQVQAPADTGGQPIRIGIYPQDAPGATGSIVGAGAGPPDYKFTLPNVVPGSYLVVAMLETQGQSYRGIQRLELGTDPVQQITIGLEPGIELAGRVVVEGEGPGPEPARVRLVPGDALPYYGRQPEAALNAGGTYRLKNVVPGVWDIDVGPIPKGGYVKSIRLGEQDVLTEDMTIDSGTFQPLNIVVSKRGGVVEGKVLPQAEGASAKPVRAVVVLAPEGRFEHVLSFYAMSLADEAGHFEFTGITPGSYRLYALDRASRFGPQDPDFLKPYRGQGEPIEVAEGGRISKDVHLIVTAERGR